MDIIVTRRQSGRTTRLIKLAAGRNLPLIVINNSAKKSAIERANKMVDKGIITKVPEIHALNEWRNGRFSSEASRNAAKYGVILDDSDYMFAELLGSPVAAMTMCEDNVFIDNHPIEYIDLDDEPEEVSESNE